MTATKLLRCIFCVCLLAVSGCVSVNLSSIQASRDKDSAKMQYEINKVSHDPTLSEVERNERLFHLLRLTSAWSLPLTRQLVEQGIPINYPNHNKEYTDAYSPLFSAIGNGNMAIVQYLLEQGADANGEQRAFGMRFYPLARAIEKNNLTIVDLLLQFGANPNVHDTNLGAPLSAALHTKNRQMINLLESAGAVASPSKEQSQAHLQADFLQQHITLQIQHALKNDNWERLHALISRYPAQLNTRDLAGRDIASQAQMFDAIACFTHLHAMHQFHLPSAEALDQLLMTSIQKGNSEALTQLLQLRKPKHSLFAEKSKAIKLQNLSSLQVLLDFNSKVDGGPQGEMNLLQQAVSHPSTEITLLLLKQKINLEASSAIEKRTPLALSIQKKQVKQAELLLEYGATPSNAGDDDNSPTFIALHQKNDALALKLMKLEKNLAPSRRDQYYSLSLQNNLHTTSTWLASMDAKEDPVMAQKRQQQKQLAYLERKITEEKEAFARQQRIERVLSSKNDPEPVIDDSNEWVGFVTNLINQTAKIAQQDREYEQRRRIKEQEYRKKRIAESQLKYEHEYNERIRRLNAEKTALLNTHKQNTEKLQQHQEELQKMREAREQARQDEVIRLERQQQKEREKQKREQQKAAEVAEQTKANDDYLKQLLAGARLGIKKCDGTIAIGGLLPKIKPKLIQCVDVHFRVTCPNTARSETGVIKAFVGMGTGCFDSIGKISSDLGCKIEDLRASAQQITRCQF